MKMEQPRHFNHTERTKSPQDIEALKRNTLQTILAEHMYEIDHPAEKINMQDHDQKNKIFKEWVLEYAGAFDEIVQKQPQWLDTDVDDPSSLIALITKLSALKGFKQDPNEGTLGTLDRTMLT